MIQCVRSSSCNDDLFNIYIFLKRNSILNVITREHLTFLAGMFTNVVSLILRDGDTDSENVSLIRRSASHGQKTCNSKGVSLIGM